MEIDWSTYKVTDSENGVKLVSELSEAAVRNELCLAIDMIDELMTRQEEAIKILQKSI